jgi:FlaA1/EpsC-like NDP-sugar epimerase
MISYRKIKDAALGILFDVLASAFSFWCAVFLAYEFSPQEGLYITLILPFIVFTALFVLLHVIFNTYKYKYKYMSIIEALKILLVGGLCAVIILLLRLLEVFQAPLSVTLIYLILYYLTALLYRFSFRAVFVLRKMFGIYRGDSPPKNILVISDLNIAGLIIRRLLQGQQMNFKPVMVLTDEKEFKGKLLGVPVTSDAAKLKSIIKHNNIKEVVLLAGYYDSKRTNDLKAICDHMNVDIKVFESVHPIAGEEKPSLRNLILEDLLDREEIKLEKSLIGSFINDKVVIVTGAAGSIGSELCRQCIMFGCKKLLAFDINENGLFELEHELLSLPGNTEIVPILASIRDVGRLDTVFQTHNPEVCFHAAAHKHVPMVEANPCEAIKNNVFGTLNVMNACDKHDLNKFIMISTDKAVNPSSVMGSTKRVAEMIIQEYGKTSATETAAVRFGNVLDSNGSVIPLFRKQIDAGGPVTITDPNVERYFMTIPEAVQLVMQAGALANQGEIFVLDMGKSVKILDLAKTLIKLAGLEPGKDIEIVTIGLRPGEKIFEELRLDSESVDNTRHEKIFICKSKETTSLLLNKQLEKINAAVSIEDEHTAMEELMLLTPSIYRKPAIKVLEKIDLSSNKLE